MPGKIRIGILGAGGIVGAHAPGFAAMADRCEVVAVAEPNPARAGRIRELFGGQVRIEPDYRQVVAAPDVDAVDILLPHDMHLPATVAAAAARRPVLIEKVMARSVAECDAMIAACARADVPLVVCHDRRYEPHWRALKRVVDSGALGDIHFWKLEHNQDVAVGPDHWIFSRERLGGGAVMSCLTHQIDALRWMGGEARTVTGMTKVIPTRMEGETVGALVAEMASGALAQLSINWFTRSPWCENGLWYELVHVSGSRGEAYFLSGRGTFVRLHEGDLGPVGPCEAPAGEGFARVIPDEACTGHVRCIREWVRMLRGEPHEVVTWGQDSRRTVAFAEAAYRAVETRRFVAVM